MRAVLTKIFMPHAFINHLRLCNHHIHVDSVESVERLAQHEQRLKPLIHISCQIHT
jgi:hypothetical protein